MTNERIFAFQSNYNLLKSAITIEQAISYAKKQNVQSLVLADTNVLYAAVDFYELALASNIRPHLGMYLETERIKALLIAKNNLGYQSLMKISSMLNKQKVDEDNILSFAQHLIVVLEDVDLDGFSLSVNHQVNDFYIQKNTLLAKNAQQLSMPIVDFPVGNCLNVEEKAVLELLAAISENTEIVNINVSVPIQEVVVKQLLEVPKILLQQTVTFDFDTKYMPKFYMKGIDNKTTFFQQLCQKGFKKRYEDAITHAHFERLNYEIEIISTMGFVDYFLILWDVMRFAKQEDIIIGPGRGSAVGSMVAYVLGITMIDPIKYNLIFERFLNIERQGLPDVDIDIEDGRRNEVIDYLRDKYGEDHVVHIGTFGTFGARSSLRDVAKAYGMTQKQITNITKQIKSPMDSIDSNIKQNTFFQKLIKENVKVSQVVEMAQKIEGFPRHTSLHAAGVILTNKPTVEYAPLIEVSKGQFATQYAMGPSEHIGLVKMDFLALRNLTIIRNIVEKVAPGKSVVDYVNTQIPEDDEKAFALLSSGKTTGIFQFESSGMRRVLQQFKIHEFLDIATVLAIYRPGPMQFINEYIDRKNNHKPYELIVEATAPILEYTYGIMIYEEQVMQLAQVVGDMTYAQADVFRRAISDKNRELLEKQRLAFIQGAERKQISSEKAGQLFEAIMAFADYGFNKSHALAYAQVSYQMAYLKSHYPATFMTELMNNSLSSSTKLHEYLIETSSFGIKILPPDVLTSNAKFTVTKDGDVRMGLLSIKELGPVAVTEIINARQEAPFTGIGNFLSRVESKKVNRKHLDQLVNSYGLSSFSKNQRALQKYLDVHEQARSFLGIEITNEIAQDVDDYSLFERREMEELAFGFTFFAHPLIGYPKNKFLLSQPPLQTTSYIVIIDNVKEITTKQGKAMAFIKVSDLVSQDEWIVFPDVFTRFQPFIKKNRIVKILLKVQKNNKNEITKSVIKIEPYEQGR